MSSLGPLDTSLIQTAQAQQVAGKSRDREKAASDRTRRMLDQVELRVAGVEAADAVRKLPGNDSEQAEAEQRSGEGHRRDEGPGGRVDVQA